jgi:hypothetical protein
MTTGRINQVANHKDPGFATLFAQNAAPQAFPEGKGVFSGYPYLG